MIRLIHGSERHAFPAEIDAMHRIRARVFHERLAWDVTVMDGWEIDAFDALEPLYLVSIDPVSGQVRGSLRLLPTTGPNMLRNVFPVLLGEGESVASATIWESSRFSINPDLDQQRTDRKLSVVTGELLAGIVEVGLLAGLSFVVSVFDARMIRIFRAAEYPADLIGTPTRIGKVMTYAGLFDISEAALASIRDACGLTGPALEEASIERRFAA